MIEKIISGMIGSGITLTLASIIYKFQTNRIRKLEDGKMDNKVCNERHNAILNSMSEIKDGQAQVWERLDQVSGDVAEISGYIRGLKNGK